MYIERIEEISKQVFSMHNIKKFHVTLTLATLVRPILARQMGQTAESVSHGRGFAIR